MYLKIVMMVFCISGLEIRCALRGGCSERKNRVVFTGDTEVSLFNDIKYDIMCRLLLKMIVILDRFRVRRKGFLIFDGNGKIHCTGIPFVMTKKKSLIIYTI